MTTTDGALVFIQEGVGSSSVTVGIPGPPAKPSFAALLGDGVALTYTVTHGFRTRRVTVQIYQTAAPYQQVFPTVELPTVDTARVIFSTAPAVGAYEIVVTG